MHHEEKWFGVSRISLTVAILALGAAAAALFMWFSGTAGGEESQAENVTSLFSSMEPMQEESEVGGVGRYLESSLVSSGAVGKTPRFVAAGSIDLGSGGNVKIFQFDDHVCMFSSVAGLGACDRLDVVRDQGIFVARPESCSRARVVGLVPDGVSSLVAKQSDETFDAIPVEQNYYDVKLPAVDTEVSSKSEGLKSTLPLASYVSMAGQC